MRDIPLIRGILLGLAVLGGVFALFSPKLLPIAALIWTPPSLTIYFLVIPVMLLVLALALRPDHTSRQRVVAALWWVYALGIVGLIAFWLYNALGAAVLDFSWAPELDPLFAVEERTSLFLGAFHLIGMLLITLFATRRLRQDTPVSPS